jgi:hypothetical protein
MKCCFVTASNNEEVLRSCLLASPDLHAGVELSIQRGAASAGSAYNRGIKATQSEVMVFAHQDVFLPEGWMAHLGRALDRLEKEDPNWGVLGIFGVDGGAVTHGHLYSAGLRSVLGKPLAKPVQIETADEVLLILRRASGLVFDESLPGFHLYGADICLQADARGLKCYAIPAFGIHNSNGLGMLPADYWRCWLYLRKKWSRRLPVRTPCMPITRWGGDALRYLVGHRIMLARSQAKIPSRVPDPRAIWVELQQNGAV